MTTEKDTPQTGKTVLLIDDDVVLLEVMEAVLKSIGCSVFTAVGGREAIDVLQKNKDSIDCLLLDLSMPDMDGWQTLAALRKITPGLPAILCSGYDQVKVMDGEYAEQVQAFLHKPYSRNDLKNTLDSLFGATTHSE